MALISGRPISFQMNLYDALFIKRPVVEPELFASLRPPSYSGGLGGMPGMAGGGGGLPRPEEKPRERAEARDKKAGLVMESVRSSTLATEGSYAKRVRSDLEQKMELGRSVASAAAAAKLGD